jgi:L,D-transpeptidase catalytic domain
MTNKKNRVFLLVTIAGLAVGCGAKDPSPNGNPLPVIATQPSDTPQPQPQPQPKPAPTPVPPQDTGDESCTDPSCQETTINAPKQGERHHHRDEPQSPDIGDYKFPDYDPSWGISRWMFEKTRFYYFLNKAAITNQRYVTIIDFSQKSDRERLFLFDLATGKVEKHLVAHGQGSDPHNTGFPTLFSNEPNSLMSSLGFYFTLDTYEGKHGYSLRLRGLELTNSNAEARDIVMHPANYVSESADHTGRSWGCPALDPVKAENIIKRVRNGSLLLMDH